MYTPKFSSARFMFLAVIILTAILRVSGQTRIFDSGLLRASGAAQVGGQIAWTNTGGPGRLASSIFAGGSGLTRTADDPDSPLVADNNLAAGDIAVTSYQADFDPTNLFTPGLAEKEDRFSIVVLKPGGLPGGTVIYITGRGWNGVSNNWLDESYPSVPVGLGHEAVMKWTVPAAGIPRGTEVFFFNLYHDELPVGSEYYEWKAFLDEPGTNPAGGLGTITNETPIIPSTAADATDGVSLYLSGQGILFYQTGPTAGPTGGYNGTPIRFITAILANIRPTSVGTPTSYASWDTAPNILNESSLPPGLVNGSTAFLMSPGPLPYPTSPVPGTIEPDNGKFNNCALSGVGVSTALQMSALIYTTGNWDYNNNVYPVGTSSNFCTYTFTAPDLTVSKAANGTFQQSGTASYTITVTNSGNGATTASYTVTDTMPTGLTAGTVTSPDPGWNCTASTSTVVSCTRTTALAAAASSTLNVPVTIAANTAPSITNVANVTGGGETNTGNNSGSATTSVTQLTTVNVNVPAGVGFTLNSVNYTNPQSVRLAPGTYALSTTSLQTIGSGVRAVFSSWSDAGAISHSITVGASPLTITGNFTTQYQLTTAASPSNGGTVTPASGSFFDSGTVVNVSATANSGFVFANWTGLVANTGSASTTVTMDTVKTITANFTAQVGVTVNVPAGVSFTLNGSTLTGSQTVQLAPGTYTLSTTTPQTLGVGTRAVFSSWSDAGAISHSIVVGSTPLTITGNFTTQYQLTTAASPSNGGTVTPASGTYYDSGTVVNVSATANSGFVFANWTGAVASAGSASTTVTMDAAKSITANFTAQVGVTVNVPAGVSFTLNGSTLTGSQTVQLAPGTYTLSTTTPQTLGSGVRAVFSSWSDAGAISHSIVVGSTPLTITGNFTTQYQLTTAASPSNGGTVTPAAGTYYDSGTVVNVSATANSGFVFANWTGAVASAGSASTTVTMDAAKSITANFTAQVGVTVNVPAGVSFTLNGSTLTGSQTVQLAPGTYTLSTTTPQTIGAGVRAVFSSWSDAGAISHSITVGASPLTITGNFTTQYQLSTGWTPGNAGTVTPASGTYFDSGTVVNVTATANSGFAFSNWTGPVANANAAATTVTMDAVKSITANFVVPCTNNPVVTNANDSGAGSLRQAVLDACAGSSITFDPSVTGQITLLGEISIGKNLSIAGNGNPITISGGGTNRVFNMTNVNGAVTFSLNFVELTGGSTSGFGGAVLNQGGSLNVSNSTIAGNSAIGGGGGIYVNGGSLTMINSTVSGNNTTSAFGGGIYNTATGTITLRSVTVTGNIGSGGGINNLGTATLGNTIVAGNSTFTTGPDVSGNFLSLGYNLIGNNSGSNFVAGNPNANTDYVGTAGSPISPQVGPLAYNGGPTRTHALLVGSRAIDSGSNLLSPPNDQRGPAYARTVDIPGVPSSPGGNATDIGAFERINPTALLSVTGRFLTSTGRPVKNATIVISGGELPPRYYVTGPFGYYSFGNLAPGSTYTLSISSKLFTVSPRIVTPYDDQVDLDLIAAP